MKTIADVESLDGCQNWDILVGYLEERESELREAQNRIRVLENKMEALMPQSSHGVRYDN